jgi:hypothetical protein
MKPALDLEIINLSKTTKNDVIIPKPLPNPIFRMLIVGSSNSGKTNFIKNILTRKQFKYKELFKKNIWLFCPTVNLSDSYDFIKDMETDERQRIFKTYDEQIIQQIKDEQTLIKNNLEEFNLKKPPELLLIFDDMIGNLPETKINSFIELFTSGRHYNINILLVTQSYYSIPLIIRRNCTHMIFFEGMSKRDITKLSNDEIPYKKDFDFYEEYIKLNRFEFVFVDTINKLYYRNLKQQLN